MQIEESGVWNTEVPCINSTINNSSEPMGIWLE
jgi:hypothetical protein